MNLEFFRDLKNNPKGDAKMDEFINELSNSLKNDSGVSKENMVIDAQKSKKSILDREEGLYYVVEENTDFVYLQNTNTDEIFKETNLPEELKQKIMEGYMLRFHDGEYYIDEEETEKYENSLVDVREYTRIKQDFLETSGILENDANTRYRVLSQNNEEDYTILAFENNGTKEIKVPNALLPYVVNSKKVFYFENRKFKTDVEETKKNLELS